MFINFNPIKEKLGNEMFKKGGKIFLGVLLPYMFIEWAFFDAFTSRQDVTIRMAIFWSGVGAILGAYYGCFYCIDRLLYGGLLDDQIGDYLYCWKEGEFIQDELRRCKATGENPEWHKKLWEQLKQERKKEWEAILAVREKRKREKTEP